MINIKNLTKKYGKHLANDNISMSIEEGCLAVLLGPNGAGKSTLIKAVCGLLRFKGEIMVGGYANSHIEAKRMLGYVPEFPSLYPMLTVWEHMEFIARAYQLKNWKNDAETLLESFEMSDKLNKLGKELSKGMQQKVNICCALLPTPRAVILDEPLVGLDPHGIRQLKNTVSALRKDGRALLISTHIIDSIDEDWDKVFIMFGGKVVSERKRAEVGDAKNLEPLYFEIIDAENKANVGS